MWKLKENSRNNERLKNFRLEVLTDDAMIKLTISVLLFSFFLLPLLSADTNLIKDASFEDKLPLWLNIGGLRNYSAGKVITESAPDGKSVLSIKGWARSGCRILSPLIKRPSPPFHPKERNQNDAIVNQAEKERISNVFSVSAKMRSFGVEPGPKVELALFDSKGKAKLVSFGEIVLTGHGKWQLFEKKGIKLKNNPGGFRFAISIKGSMGSIQERRVELDQIGLFAKKNLGEISDNSDTHIFEAEDLADGVVWKKADYSHPTWYRAPSKMKMLTGFHPLKKGLKLAVTRPLNIRENGKFKLWYRYLTSGKFPGKSTISIKQDGKTVASKSFDGLASGGYRWEWSSMSMTLKKGKASIVLSRPNQGSVWLTRHFDLFVLTNNLNYQANIHDFMPAGYMRFTNLSQNQLPFCLWIWVRRHQSPWYANPGILSMSGNSRSYYVSQDKSLWLANGYTSPWIKISDDLLSAGGRNNVSLTATRQNHVNGFVKGSIKGKLEFALGRKKIIIKTIKINQDNPRILLTLPADFKNKRAEIRSSSYYIDEKQALLEKLKKPSGRPPRHLDISAHLSLSTEKDDLNVIEGEIAILKQLGFNNIYNSICPAEDALDFNKEHHLLPNFRVSLRQAWSKRKENSMYHPDSAAIEKIVQDIASKKNSIKNHILSFDLMDEPHGMSYEQILKSDLCVRKFRNYLKKSGFSPEELGVNRWNEVKPIRPAEKENNPVLFYHTAIFRLKAMPYFTRTITKIKNKYFPKKSATYCNYSPPISGSSWTIRGVDPFFLHRNNGLEMPWSEDWLGYGVGVQHMSDIYALLRAAAGKKDQPLGGYVVGSPFSTKLIRMKLYTAIAAGLRQVSVYCYGPYYAGIDSWSRALHIYQELSNSLHELGTIDEALHGTTRMKTDIAILYNRTASIWADKNYTSDNNNRHLHWALAHAGYDADFIPEEDIEDGDLDKYKVLYIGGMQMRKKCAKTISSWVKKGGILFGCAGAGIRDEYNRPMRILGNVFGVESVDCKLVNNIGRPRYELRTQKSLAVISTTGEDTPQVIFDQLCFSEKIAPHDKAMTIAKTAKGHCAGVKNKFGKGIAIRIAAMPGISYVNEAVKGKDYDIEAYLPKKFGKSLREFIAWPAKLAKAVKIAETKEPITEIIRYDGKNHAVVFIIDHDAAKKKEMIFRLFDAGQFTKAYSATGEPVKIRKQKNNTLLVTMPMNIADAIVLEK